MQPTARVRGRVRESEGGREGGRERGGGVREEIRVGGTDGLNERGRKERERERERERRTVFASLQRSLVTRRERMDSTTLIE